MSLPVALSALADRIGERGPIAHLVTVARDGRAHVVSVRVEWAGAELVVGAGRKTAANVEQQAGVTLLWAAPPGEGYSLIVDGSARSLAGPDRSSLVISPTGAVLHRLPDGDPTAPACVPVLTPPVGD